MHHQATWEGTYRQVHKPRSATRECLFFLLFQHCDCTHARGSPPLINHKLCIVPLPLIYMPMAGKLSVISTAQSAFPKNCGRLFAFLTIVAVKLDFAITFASNSCCFFNRNGNVTVPEPPEVFRNSWQNPQLFRQEQAVSELRVFPKGVHSYCNPRVLSFLYEEQGRID